MSGPSLGPGPGPVLDQDVLNLVLDEDLVQVLELDQVLVQVLDLVQEQEIMEFEMPWVHLTRNGLILRQVKAICIRIISKPSRPQEGP